MNAAQRLQLKDMIKTNNVEDQTGLIRTLKHSTNFKTEVAAMIAIKQSHAANADITKNHVGGIVYTECAQKCTFMFNYYTDIFNKILKDQLNLDLFDTFVNVLAEIENGNLDQHEGAFKIGTILKEMYVDSAISNIEGKDEEAESEAEPKIQIKPKVDISWDQYKASRYAVVSKIMHDRKNK